MNEVLKRGAGLTLPNTKEANQMKLLLLGILVSIAMAGTTLYEFVAQVRQHATTPVITLWSGDNPPGGNRPFGGG